jgi:hypothetical protein
LCPPFNGASRPFKAFPVKKKITLVTKKRFAYFFGELTLMKSRIIPPCMHDTSSMATLDDLSEFT